MLQSLVPWMLIQIVNWAWNGEDAGPEIDDIEWKRRARPGFFRRLQGFIFRLVQATLVVVGLLATAIGGWLVYGVVNEHLERRVEANQVSRDLAIARQIADDLKGLPAGWDPLQVVYVLDETPKQGSEGWPADTGFARKVAQGHDHVLYAVALDRTPQPGRLSIELSRQREARWDWMNHEEEAVRQLAARVIARKTARSPFLVSKTAFDKALAEVAAAR